MFFRSAFKRVFSEGLAPHGFVLLKGTCVFGKLIDEKILLYITIHDLSPIDRGVKRFEILCGVQTVYSYDLCEHQLAFSAIPQYGMSYEEDTDEVTMFYSYNSECQEEVLREALEDTLEILIPKLSEVKDLPSCVSFLGKYHWSLLYNADKLERDSILLLLTEDRSSFEEAFSISRASLLNAYHGNESDPYFVSSWAEMEKRIREDLIGARERALAEGDTALKKAKEEASSREAKNRETLRKYGLLR